MSNSSCTFGLELRRVSVTSVPPCPPTRTHHLTTAFTDSKTHSSVPKVIYIEQPGQNDKCVIALLDANEDFIFMSSLHSRALLLRSFLAQMLPILCQRRASDKRRFITAGE